MGIDEQDRYGGMECSAVSVARYARRRSTGTVTGIMRIPGTLSGYLVDYLEECTDLVGPMTAEEWAYADDTDEGLFEPLDGRWAEPMTFSDVQALCEPAHRMTKEEATRFSATVGDCHVDVPADWNSR